ncbi:2,3-bisphosphoglycerate-independent phosphoglycerate mutase [Candidatus Babeliales bacterium]|nr:2,3-bisphosphoglycerate-independent phosphoglycerate mutase [Candidatus Babeliales bacterium]MCF7899206.1 2,3-bisphosphoglycerate-independent phosphoglycerate mutase [Candidatus Babeliales bacterium]
MSKQKNSSNPTMLLILDGFGYNESSFGNAIKKAHMPNWNRFLAEYPHKLIQAAGEFVGLMPGFIGNSEVGHANIGCGRIVETDFVKFNEAIEDGSIFENKILINNFEKIKKLNKSLHLMGLLSDAGVHSYINHLFALIKLAKELNLKNVFVHAFLDGRDVPPKSAAKYLQELEVVCDKNNYKIASLHGRFYAMDRDKNWDRTQKSYDVLCKFNINTQKTDLTWQQVLKSSYDQNITDEFLEPTLLVDNGYIKENDGIFFFNFRPDRAIQLTESFIDPEFNKFPVKNLNSTKNTISFFITPVRYKKDFTKFNNEILFEKEAVKHTLLDEIAEQTHGKKVFIIAETEKYAHVTYFFRGLCEKQLPSETRKLIPSIKAKNYVEHPEMSAEKITQEILYSLKNDPAYFYLVNYANPDMVGHSGDFEATIKACEFIDKQLGILYQEIVEKLGGTIFITGDHGNAENMIDEKTGGPITAHTNNPVVFMMINKNLKNKINKNTNLDINSKLCLANIAPTILKYLELKIPKDMLQETIFDKLN